MSTTDVVPQCECVLAAQIDFLLNYEEIKRKKKQIEFKVIVIWRTCNIHILLKHIIIAIILDKWRKQKKMENDWKKKLHRKTYFKWNLIQTWEIEYFKKNTKKNIIFVISYLWSNQIRKLREFIQPLKMEEKKLQFNIRTICICTEQFLFYIVINLFFNYTPYTFTTIYTYI